MKKMLIGMFLGVLLVGAALFAVSTVNAQGTNPPQPGTGFGPGMMGRGGGMMGGGAGLLQGSMHDDMVAAFAAELGLSADEINQRIDAGETMWQIAEAEGLSWDEFYAVMQEARSEALAQAVADGTITQEQADWMQSHMQGRGAGAGFGCHGQGTAPQDGTGFRGGRFGGMMGRWSQQTN